MRLFAGNSAFSSSGDTRMSSSAKPAREGIEMIR
jgi:hypothetical protein